MSSFGTAASSSPRVFPSGEREDPAMMERTLEETPDGNMIEAEPVGPVVIAEPVPPPTNAVQVLFDEELEPNHTIDGSAVPNQDDMEETKETRRQFCLRVGGLFLLLVMCLCIGIPVAQHMHSHDLEDGVMNEQSALLPTGAMSMAPTFSYECFTSTSELTQAQLLNPDQTLFIVCPHTKIQMGILANPSTNDTRVVQGDMALMITRPNVEVRCGWDGSVTNQCVLVGGFLQALLTPLLPSHETGGIVSKPTHNVVIRGMTFTGQIVSDVTFGGASAAISNPGRNMQFIHCLWENITTPSGLLHVGTNMFQMLAGMEPLGIQVTDLHIVNSTFRNIVYDGPLLNVWDQNLTLAGCRFEHVQLSPFLGMCHVGPHEWCQSLVLCSEGSVCRLQDLCVSDFEYAGYGAILAATNDTKIHLSGFHFFGPNITVHPSASRLPSCDSGFVQVNLQGEQPTCMNLKDNGSVDLQWNASDACLL